MASPFSVFRRNQKVMMAVVTVAAMFAFVILDPLMKYVGRGAERTDPIVVETRYGGLHESDLQSLRQTRRTVEIFVEQMVQASVEGLAQQKQIDPRQISMAMEFQLNQTRRYFIRSKQNSEEAAVETYVLAKRAEQLGIVVSDVAINDFLKQITFDSLTTSQIAQIIGDLKSQGMPMSQGRMFDALRNELLAFQLTQMFEVGVTPMPPGQRWDYFERVNRRANVELLALPVANYLADVPDPKEAELRKFFDKYKNKLPQAGSADPGFKQPKKAAFQYFKADFDKFVERCETEITDAQIQEYYEKFKDTRFRVAKLPPESDAPETKPAVPADSAPANPATPAKEGDAKPAPDAGKPAAETPAPAAATTPPAAAPATPVAPPATTPAPAATPANPAPNAESTKPPKSARAPRRSEVPVRLVSDSEILLAQAAPPKAPAKPPAAAAKPAPVAKPAAPAVTQPAAPATPPAAAPAPAAAATPAATPSSAAPAASPPAAEQPKSSDTEKTDAAKTDAAAEPVQYEPLDKVKDTIRKELARAEARRQINKAIETLEASMKQYSDNLLVYETQPDDAKGTAPTPLDFDALAKEFGLTKGETDLISAEEARDETGIGRSYFRVPDNRSRFGERMETFEQVAFDDSFPKFKPVRSEDISANYVFWKTKTSEEQVPDFDKVKPQVLRAWKMIAARKIAQEKAEKDLQEAKRDKATLEATFGKQPELKVLKPPMFSWISMGMVPRDPSADRPRLSEVVGVEEPGEEFMRTVFDLKPGDYAVAMNQPQATVYVIHLLDFDRTLDAMFDQFGKEPFQMYRAIGFDDMIQAYRSWVDNVMTEAKVHWERDPTVERERVRS